MQDLSEKQIRITYSSFITLSLIQTGIYFIAILSHNTRPQTHGGKEILFNILQHLSLKGHLSQSSEQMKLPSKQTEKKFIVIASAKLKVVPSMRHC